MNFVESAKAGVRIFCTGLFFDYLQQQKKDHKKILLLQGDDDNKILSLDFLVVLYRVRPLA